jgi:pilus assembly protein Flp/PilA
MYGPAKGGTMDRTFVLFYGILPILYEILPFSGHPEVWVTLMTERAMHGLISRYLRQEEGATAIEYSLIATGISIAIVVVVYTMGEDVAALYEGFIGIFTS